MYCYDFILLKTELGRCGLVAAKDRWTCRCVTGLMDIIVAKRDANRKFTTKHSVPTDVTRITPSDS